MTVGASMAGSMCGRGSCMAGAMHGRGYVWHGGCAEGLEGWWGCAWFGMWRGGHGWGRVWKERWPLLDGTHPTGMHSCLNIKY